MERARILIICVCANFRIIYNRKRPHSKSDIRYTVFGHTSIIAVTLHLSTFKHTLQWPNTLAHLVEDNRGGTHSQVGVVPVKVLVNLGLLLEVSWVPVVGQLVLAHQVLHYCSTTGILR